jgi:hypothetical protein
MRPLIALSLSALGLAGLQTVPDWHHKYKEGDKSTYTMHMVEHLEQADADVNATWTETVKTVGADGGANVEMVYNDFKITAGGMDVPAPPPEPRTMHFTPRGLEHLDEIAELTSVSRLNPTVFSVFTYMTKLDPSSIGSVEETKDEYGEVKETGKAKLIAIKDGFAQIDLSFSLEAKDWDTPLKGDFSFYVNVATDELDHMSGKLTSLPSKLAGRYQVQGADFTIKRS